MQFAFTVMELEKKMWIRRNPKHSWFRWFLHDIMEWLRTTKEQSFTGVSVASTCRDCGDRVLQDSQGNWFHLGKIS